MTPKTLDRIAQVIKARESDFATLVAQVGIDPQVDFREADLSHVDFGTLDLANADFTNSNLSGANLSRTLNFSRALIHGADLSGAELPVDRTDILPRSWDKFQKWCDDTLSGRVVLMPRARRGIRNAAFKDVEFAARCLLWLANDGHNRRMEGGSGTIREVVVEDRIRNAHCGKDQYQVLWNGQKYTVDWYIKNGGTTRDPTRCLRIYYFWDPIAELIVVADMPAHRTTGAT